MKNDRSGLVLALAGNITISAAAFMLGLLLTIPVMAQFPEVQSSAEAPPVLQAIAVKNANAPESEQAPVSEAPAEAPAAAEAPTTDNRNSDTAADGGNDASDHSHAEH